MWLNQENAQREKKGHEISYVLKPISFLLTGTLYVRKFHGLYLSHKTHSLPAN